MRIGIISDTHDDLQTLDQALGILVAEGISTLLHCGDLCSPAVLEALAGFDTWVARGNMDRHPDLGAAARRTVGADQFADRHRLTLDGRSAILLHGHRQEELRSIISAGEYAYVFHGHTHRRRDQQVGPIRVINPGALGGMRWQRRSFCILDVTAGEAEFRAV
jgi:hypothetical protein